MEIVNYKPFEKGTMKAFFSVMLPNFGMQIDGCTHHEKNGKQWVTLPMKEYFNEANEKKYIPVVKFYDSAMSDLFNRECLKAISAKQDKIKKLTAG